jgi:peptide/nickel transport system permease protein
LFRVSLQISNFKFQMSKLIFRLILSRIAQGILVLLILSILIFGLLAAAGGDAVSALADSPNFSEEAARELRRIYGLDQPFLQRYANWVGDLAGGRLGYSISLQAPVGEIILPRLFNTAALAALAMTVAWVTALTLGTAAAARAGSLIDRLCSLTVILAASTPRLVLALLTLSLMTQIPHENTARGWFIRLVPPSLVLSVPLVALLLAQMRGRVREMYSEEFVRAARAKGSPERIVLFRHVLRPSLNPLITISGYALGSLISGSVIVESVFGWPGLSQLSVSAVQSRDVPLLMGIVLVTATTVLAGNLLADILLRLNDPRLR